jgi:hypothetical protein
MEQENNFTLGRSSEISRDEVKFAKFVERLRNKFSEILYKALRIQLILKGVITEEDWNDMKYTIRFDFKRDNYYAESKDTEILQNRVNMLGQVAPYIGQFFSAEYVQKQILRMTDEDIEQMKTQMSQEQPPQQPLDGNGENPPAEED